MHGELEKKRKGRKLEEKEDKSGIKSQKKAKNNNSMRIFSFAHSSVFGSIRNARFRVKPTYLLLFLCKI